MCDVQLSEAASIKRVLIRLHGENGIRALSRALRVTEDDSLNTMPREAFAQRLRDFGLKSADSVTRLLNAFDRGDATIQPTEVLTALRSGLNPLRRSLIRRAFDCLDKDINGALSVTQMLHRFDASKHPSVICNEAKAQEVYDKLLSSFSADSTNPEGVVSKQEFEQFLAGLSSTIESDDTFAALLRGCWSITGMNPKETARLAARREGKHMSAMLDAASKEALLSTLKTEDTLKATVQQHRDAALNTSLGFRGVGRALRLADKENTGFVSQEDFVAALWENRLYFSQNDALHLLDTNNDGSIDYLYYLSYLVTELPPRRRLLLERMWHSFSRDRAGRVALTDIHRRFTAPDGETLNRFLDAWDQRTTSNRVSFAEMEEWMSTTSAKCHSDSAFAETLRYQWGLAT